MANEKTRIMKARSQIIEIPTDFTRPSDRCFEVITGSHPFPSLLVMFRFDTSPAKSESSSASNTEDTSSSTQTVNSLHYDVAYCQPPKSSAKDFADQAQSHRDEPPPPNQETIEEEYGDGFDTWPKPKEGYTRRLIPVVLVPIDEIGDDFDEDAFNKKSYPNVEIVDMRNVPKGWILVNGITAVQLFY
jgi:hypothetical protein